MMLLGFWALCISVYGVLYLMITVFCHFKDKRAHAMHAKKHPKYDIATGDTKAFVKNAEAQYRYLESFPSKINPIIEKMNKLKEAEKRTFSTKL